MTAARQNECICVLKKAGSTEIVVERDRRGHLLLCGIIREQGGYDVILWLMFRTGSYSSACKFFAEVQGVSRDHGTGPVLQFFNSSNDH